jgi:hypothetical protein
MSTLPYRLASIKVNPDVKPVLGALIFVWRFSPRRKRCGTDLR